MAQAWQPATELEVKLRDALRTGDRDAYFRLLTTAELIVPAPPEAAADPSRLRWPTEWVKGRTQLTVYTSPQAMRMCRDAVPGTFVTMTLRQLASAWPDPQWWLAVNAELPIESYLPAWFIQQLAGGDPRLPAQAAAASSAPPPPPPAPPPPAPPVPSSLPSSAPSSLPASMPSSMPSSMSPSLPPSMSPSMAPGGSPSMASSVPPAPSPSGPMSPVSADFRPANSSEEALLEAAAQNDNDRFLKVLMYAQIYVPIAPDAPETARPGDPGFHWGTAEIKGQISVLLFTSVERMRERIGNVRYAVSDFPQIIRVWPHGGWALALNPDTKVGATLPGEQVRALVRWAEEAGSGPGQGPGSAPASPAPAPGGSAPGPYGGGTYGTGGGGGYGDGGSAGPYGPPGGAGGSGTGPASVPPSGPGTYGSPGPYSPPGPYGGPGAYADAGAPSPSGGAPAGAPGDPLTSRPGGGHGIDFTALPGDPLAADPLASNPLASDLRRGGPGGGDEPGGPPAPMELDVPVTVGTSGSAGGGTATLVPARAAVITPPAARAIEAPGRPGARGTLVAPLPAGPVMQKVVPHAQVTWYLDRGHARVNGFVYQAADVIHLETPIRMYEELGLPRSGSLFSPADQSVHVVRWHAHFSGLHRPPYGDGNEEAPRGTGNIPVYQVSDMQLPHGSEIFVIGTDGSQRFVASYDADRLAWQRAEDE